MTQRQWLEILHVGKEGERLVFGVGRAEREGALDSPITAAATTTGLVIRAWRGSSFGARRRVGGGRSRALGWGGIAEASEPALDAGEFGVLTLSVVAHALDSLFPGL